jgi:hypothetical protein
MGIIPSCAVLDLGGIPMGFAFMRNTHAPEFPEDLDWIGSQPLRLAGLRGRFVLLDFWTFG